VAIREFAVVVGAVLAVTILKEPMDCCKVHVLLLVPPASYLLPAFSFLRSPFYLPATRPLLLLVLPPTCFLPSASYQLLPARYPPAAAAASSYLLPAASDRHSETFVFCTLYVLLL